MKNIDAIIKKYVGVPFKHQGRTLEGLDCWGLLKLIYKDLGYELWDINEEYDKNWFFPATNRGGSAKNFGGKGKDYFLEHYHQDWLKINPKETKPEPGDGILFINNKGMVNHAGVFIGYGKFIHTSVNLGTVISRVNTDPWEKRLEGFYRLKK